MLFFVGVLFFYSLEFFFCVFLMCMKIQFHDERLRLSGFIKCMLTRGFDWLDISIYIVPTCDSQCAFTSLHSIRARHFAGFEEMHLSLLHL